MTSTDEQRTALNRLPVAYCDATRLGNLCHRQIVEALASTQSTDEWSEDIARLDALKLPLLTGGVNPGDRQALYCLIRHCKPLSILEVGTHIGSSTLAIALAAARNRADGIDTRIVTIDIRNVNDERTMPWLAAGSPLSPRELLRNLGLDDLVEFRTGSAVDLLSSPGLDFDLIFLDGDHSSDAVYREIPLALSRLCKSSLSTVILHDYFPDMRRLWPDEEALPGPYLAVERLVSEGARFNVLPLGEVPWTTKHGSRLTSLAVLTSSPLPDLPRDPGKVAFVVTSQGNDRYSVMARIALASLRLSNPSLQVIVACDNVSDRLMHDKQDPLVGEADEWLAVDTPDGNPVFRNRYVKTSLRARVKGPLLMLDSDILVRGNIQGIFSMQCDIAGARNHSRELLFDQIWAEDRMMLDQMGWHTRRDNYINGGVLLLNDTDAAHAFAASWHARWLESTSRASSFRDQPALNSALAIGQLRLGLLPDCFNAQILARPEVARGALIWHFYSSVELPNGTMFESLVSDVLNGGEVNIDRIQQMMTNSHPWVCDALVEIWSHIGTLERERARLEMNLDSLRTEHQNTLNSRSWRITSPLRAVDALLRKAAVHTSEADAK